MKRIAFPGLGAVDVMSGADIPHGDVAFTPRLTIISEMEAVERANGGVDPDALIPRFKRWWERTFER